MHAWKAEDDSIAMFLCTVLYSVKCDRRVAIYVHAHSVMLFRDINSPGANIICTH